MIEGFYDPKKVKGYLRYDEVLLFGGPLEVSLTPTEDSEPEEAQASFDPSRV